VGNPWCAAFVYWCIDEAANQYDAINSFVRTAYCPDIASWGRSHDCLYDTPQPGDVFLRWGTVSGVYRASHTGFVTSVEGTSFRTVEGNTNLNGSRQGVGVFQLRRTNSNRFKFVRWGNVLKTPAQRETEQQNEQSYTLWVGEKELWKMPIRDGRALCPVRKWGDFFTFEVEWNNEEQCVLFDGRELETELVFLDLGAADNDNRIAYAPVRDLVECAGLRLQVFPEQQKVLVTRQYPTNPSG
jgi:hypothetical protein